MLAVDCTSPLSTPGLVGLVTLGLFLEREEVEGLGAQPPPGEVERGSVGLPEETRCSLFIFSQ